LPLPVLFFPAIANFALVKAKLWPKGQFAGKLFETVLVCTSLAVALPMSIAMFQQRSEIDPKLLEVEFKQLKDKND